MTEKRGKMIYVPKIVFGELDDIMREESVHRRAEAFDKLAVYAKLGRQVKTKARLEGLTIKDLFEKKKQESRKKSSVFEGLL